MGENTEELVVSLENSLSSDICDTVGDLAEVGLDAVTVSYTHLRAHET